MTINQGLASFLDDLKVMDLDIYPNPTKGELTIDLEKVSDLLTIKIINLIGKEVKIIQVPFGDQVKRNVPGASGAYFMELKVKNTRSTFSVIK